MLLLQGHLHAQPFGFVRELVAHTAKGPLMDTLIIRGASIVILPDIAHIANDHGLHALLMQRGNKFARLLVLNILLF